MATFCSPTVIFLAGHSFPTKHTFFAELYCINNNNTSYIFLVYLVLSRLFQSCRNFSISSSLTRLIICFTIGISSCIPLNKPTKCPFFTLSTKNNQNKVNRLFVKWKHLFLGSFESVSTVNITNFS